MSSTPSILQADVQTLLQCPHCNCTNLVIDDDGAIACPDCDTRYRLDGDTGVTLFAEAFDDGETKSNIQKWWGDLYAQLYRDHDNDLTPDELDRQLDDLVDMFRSRGHIAVTEMDLNDLDGTKILEIGSGAGAHSCLYKRAGADVVSVDITPDRALSTQRKLAMAKGPGPARAYQADGEHLPFRDASFDVVYSNGVLHHSDDTDACIAEVHRVLKPGGKAVIMLYSRHSANFWLSVLPRALLFGKAFRMPEANWIGHVTEGTPKHGTTRNPITRVYSAREMKRAFAAFDIESLRKSSFQFDNFAIPRGTQMRDRILKVLGRTPHVGGMLVYGKPYFNDTALEVSIGRFAGWCWHIVAQKSRDPA